MALKNKTLLIIRGKGYHTQEFLKYIRVELRWFVTVVFRVL